MKELVKQKSPDYRMNLIDARHMSDEEIDRFEGDLRAFLLMLRDRFDREKLKTAVAIHRETWYAISKIKNDKRYKEYIDSVPDEVVEGGVYMDAALDYIEARGKAIGEARGVERVNRLGIIMSKAGRADEFLTSLSDKALQKRFLTEFGLDEEK